MTGNKGDAPFIIGNHFFIGCGFFILGFILAAIGFFGAIGEGLKGESQVWSNFLFGLFIAGLGLVVSDPLVWRVILPISNSSGSKKNNVK